MVYDVQPRMVCLGMLLLLVGLVLLLLRVLVCILLDWRTLSLREVFSLYGKRHARMPGGRVAGRLWRIRREAHVMLMLLLFAGSSHASV